MLWLGSYLQIPLLNNKNGSRIRTLGKGLPGKHFNSTRQAADTFKYLLDLHLTFISFKSKLYFLIIDC